MDEENFEGGLLEHISRFRGETVTVYTTSGGQSGFGFTGVLIKIDPCFIRLVTRFGAPPECALGSSCRGARNLGRGSWGSGCGGFNNSLGSVVDIPIDKIAGFVHNDV